MEQRYLDRLYWNRDGAEIPRRAVQDAEELLPTYLNGCTEWRVPDHASVRYFRGDNGNILSLSHSVVRMKER